MPLGKGGTEREQKLALIWRQYNQVSMGGSSLYGECHPLHPSLHPASTITRGFSSPITQKMWVKKAVSLWGKSSNIKKLSEWKIPLEI